MRNVEVKQMVIGADFNTETLLNAARNDERKNKALAVSIRMEALAIFITRNEMSGADAAELLRQEAKRFEHEALEFH
ncbi:DUF2732 domain-containing protein [Erwiniaceae bacterium BAC15a-03b]|uniref:DUF2732 domain-containing protein n=1 Tax=Winslowiella arboricola TaxID=2978220 RepID=A0A9J6PPG0_9GAMM|nr:DUF2732 family protein [Winslowiella arboricola]MCU5775836.1 DUF2732 domain-containing protein [Winslowiella arboricola]MCU5779314.1 DUF2732 domain-containing protein [Winslowiella arboricola]